MTPALLPEYKGEMRPWSSAIFFKLSCSQNSVSFGNSFGKAAKSPLFPLNLRLLSQKLKFWESLSFFRF
jgi:hypothetical protein